MTGRRKSCKTCKKAAASSLPIVEVGLPEVDGFLFQNTDDEENRSPGFRSRTAEANSDPAAAGTADAALARTEPTPGFRKTASRKAATQASSFAAVAQQKDKGEDNNEAKDNGMINTKDSPCTDKKEAKDAAGCSDQRASKAEVAVHVEAGSRSIDVSDYMVLSTFEKMKTKLAVHDESIPLKLFNDDKPAKAFIKSIMEWHSSASAKEQIDDLLSKVMKSHKTVFGLQNVENSVIRAIFMDPLSRRKTLLERQKKEAMHQFVEEVFKVFLEVKLLLCLNGDPKNWSPSLSNTLVKRNDIKTCYKDIAEGAVEDDDPVPGFLAFEGVGGAVNLLGKREWDTGCCRSLGFSRVPTNLNLRVWQTLKENSRPMYVPNGRMVDVPG